MKEAKFTTEIIPWLIDNIKSTCAIEYKAVSGGTFNIKQWKKKEPQQSIELNNSVTKKGTYYKIPDLGRDTKPYDAFYICNAKALLIIWFDKYKEFFVLPIQDVNKMGGSIAYKVLKQEYEAHKLIPKPKVEHEAW